MKRIDYDMLMDDVALLNEIDKVIMWKDQQDVEAIYRDKQKLLHFVLDFHYLG